VVPSLSLGGAEKIVADLARAWSECGTEADVVVLRDAPAEHTLGGPGISVHRLGTMPWPERFAYAAGLIRASRLPAFCHLTPAAELAKLWRYGCRTVPVVHNARSGWRDNPLNWDVTAVPFVVACGEHVARDLAAAGLAKPVRVFRHLVAPALPMRGEHRRGVRKAFGAAPSTVLMGMVGRIVPQKRYTKAVRVLAALLERGQDARLVIIGGTRGDDGRVARAAIEAEARRLGVRHALVLAGPVAHAHTLLGALDVFLNTSLWEGVSVATMEAVAAGIPVVTADVGGQREAIGAGDTLMAEDSNDTDWASAVEAAVGRRGGRAVDIRARHAAAHLWPWTLALGPGAELADVDKQCDLLFVTGNMDVGGAQRSLCNLAAELPVRGVRCAIAVCGAFGVPGFMTAALAAGVDVLDLSASGTHKGGLTGRVGRVLSLALALRPRTLVFWNMDAATKMAVAKAMAGGPIKVCDVSPGPMLYTEFDREVSLAQALSTSPDGYLASLDLLVAKYSGGGPAACRGQPRAIAVIPNGVPAAEPLLPADQGPRPVPSHDPSRAVVTVGRLTAAKRPELFPLVAAALARRAPGASLTVVGAAHSDTQVAAAWQAMLDACGGQLPGNLHFVGPDHRTLGFLPRFAAFYMVSDHQGCPNASLEALASGLPVVANPDGGTAEQIVDGVNGRLVADPGDPAAFAEALAAALAEVVTDPARRAGMAMAARETARRFSMATMAESYIDALLGPQRNGGSAS
jgi:glycosyltransferase involved in cell wall biosynthesis